MLYLSYRPAWLLHRIMLRLQQLLQHKWGSLLQAKLFWIPWAGIFEISCRGIRMQLWYRKWSQSLPLVSSDNILIKLPKRKTTLTVRFIQFQLSGLILGCDFKLVECIYILMECQQFFLVVSFVGYERLLVDSKPIWVEYCIRKKDSFLQYNHSYRN